jgi:hypothetical protein
MAEWALVPLERGKDDAALLGGVAMLDQVTGHGSSLPPRSHTDIGAPP